MNFAPLRRDRGRGNSSTMETLRGRWTDRTGRAALAAGAGVISCLVASPAWAQSFTVFATRAELDAAAGDQTVEDFEDAEYARCTSPVSAASDDACFDPGDIAEGVTFTPLGGLRIIDNSPLGKGLTTDGGGEFNLAFQPPVAAVGLIAFERIALPEFYVTAYDEDGEILGSVERGNGGSPIFFGLGSSTPIARLRVIPYAGGGISEVVYDDVAFSPSLCGNGVVEPGEACDAAGEAAGCDADCSLAECGDGVLNTDAGEQCDDGGESAGCDDDCTAVACGDDNANETAGESCDQGGDGGPLCDPDCTLAACGDGVLNSAAGEECERDGGSADCDDDCTLVVCGDGTTNLLAGEQCDAGGESASCDDDCTLSDCGDVTVNVVAGEQCDDGETTATCDADCTLSGCGDALLNTDAGEQCDDGGESAGCDDDCTYSSCGDGVLNETAGEDCDDSNDVSGDGCSSDCADEPAGQGGSGEGASGGGCGCRVSGRREGATGAVCAAAILAGAAGGRRRRPRRRGA